MQKVSMSFRPVSLAISLMIRSTSAQIIFLKQQLGEIDKMIVKITKDNGAVQTLLQHNGTGIQTASTNHTMLVLGGKFPLFSDGLFAGESNM